MKVNREELPFQTQMGEGEFMQFMWNAWEDRWGEVKCMECKKVLQFHPQHCAHVLSKGSYPFFRTDMRNLIPLCTDDHHWFDNGKGQLTRRHMKIWPFVEKTILELKNEYSRLFLCQE